jgi:N-methylhydantoinase A
MMASRIGVDIGGTFSDLLYYDDESGQVLVGKVPTTPGHPEEGCMAAIEQVLPGRELSRIQFFLHGTTVGLNALLERRGATVGLLHTAGFRDILDLRRGSRKNFNLKWSPPPSLVPRRLRFPVRERILADRSVHVPLERSDVLAALEKLQAEGVTSVAVAYMNAYGNGAHELETERILREAGFKGAISLSHRVSGEYREFERTSTTVIDAFVRARMAEYLGQLESRLHTKGFAGTSLIMRSGGGSMTFAEASERPFETIMSGPVAGAEGAGELSRRLGLGDLITADVGGTSFDTGVIVDGRPKLLYQGTVGDMPVQTPWVDVRSIGAGGGSIARVDVGGLLRVGPESAGAVPGPACYGRGGTEPTVTDAALYLGMLGDGRIASGMVLDREKAAASLSPLAKALGYSTPQLALGIMNIAAVAMANVIREITVEYGLDPRKMKLFAFGGAGPLMATEVARALDIQHIVIPPHAGNFSACGLLGTDLLRTHARTRVLRLSDAALGEVNELLDGMFADLTDHANGVRAAPAVKEVTLDLRYVGQEHTLNVMIPSLEGRIAASATQIHSLFRQGYQRTFGTLLERPVEIVSTRASVRRQLPGRSESAPVRGDTRGATRQLEAHSFAKRRNMSFTLLERDTMPVGERMRGPLIINELTTTTYVDADCAVEVDSSSCLHVYFGENAP